MSTDTELAGRIAEEAGRRLLEIRAGWAGDDPKELGRLGDLESNRLILAALPDGDAVLSEESADDPRRLEADRVWIVDPLDGTREFTMEGRKDWAVHVALWERDRGITAAAVAQPALDEVYLSGSTPDLADREPAGEPVVLVSDSRPPAFAADVAAAAGGRVQSMGSAGAKAMAVLRGDADAYVHAGGQWEWDSAAPVGVVLAAGLHASRIDGSPLIYNEAHPYLPDLLICTSSLAPVLLEALARAG